MYIESRKVIVLLLVIVVILSLIIISSTFSKKQPLENTQIPVVQENAEAKNQESLSAGATTISFHDGVEFGAPRFGKYTVIPVDNVFSIGQSYRFLRLADTGDHYLSGSTTVT